jgi:hypothetical protein
LRHEEEFVLPAFKISVFPRPVIVSALLLAGSAAKVPVILATVGVAVNVIELELLELVV